MRGVAFPAHLRSATAASIRCRRRLCPSPSPCPGFRKALRFSARPPVIVLPEVAPLDNIWDSSKKVAATSTIPKLSRTARPVIAPLRRRTGVHPDFVIPSEALRAESRNLGGGRVAQLSLSP